jgi:hypothetical protein
MRWRKLFHREQSDADLLQEIHLHLAEEIDENVGRGMSPEQARRQAYLEFGNTQRVRETLWQQNTLAFVESISRDLTYALRTLSRTPGFTLMAVLLMALGIGATIRKAFCPHFYHTQEPKRPKVSPATITD